MSMLIMKNKLVVIGGGDFCWELLSWIPNELKVKYELKGFLDDNTNLSPHPYYLGKLKEYSVEEGDFFICAIANTQVKLDVCHHIEKKGGEFVNIIHSTSVVSDEAKLGKGCVIGPHSYIAYEAIIGNHVLINVSTTVGHHARIADGCSLNSHVDVTGHVELDEGVFLGSHASILPGKKVGAFSKVGAGSVVFRNVEKQITVFGVPAKRILI